MEAVNSVIVNFVKILPKSVVHLFSKKYIAGEKLEDGIRVVKELNARGIIATMDVLGESVQTIDDAISAKKGAIQVLEAINEHELNSNLSIKPTQLGLLIDAEFCYNQLKEIVQRAKELNNFVRIDMEDSSVTDAIFNLFGRLKEEYSNVGIVVQAYLKRNIADVDRLNKNGTNYRLCKGIYVEPEEIAFKNRDKIREKFLEALELMLDNGNYVGIATHDDPLVEGAYKMIEEKNLSKDKYEFQMLYGVKDSLRDKINSDGHKIRVYVPFGEHWHAYSIRRLQENPALAWYITKSIFSLN
ncbi:MAG: proline dehydrogenase family protein [Bacteroidetes bacterium]|nr:proline dehydrogenase family protein [Bacteroidota bacterium]MBU2506429.1 proline dehydrogenase family protein [Bacteroidota bacterium]